MTGGWWDALLEGVRYLLNLDGGTGKGAIRAGPKACGRINCSYDTVMFTCNDVSLSFSSSVCIS